MKLYDVYLKRQDKYQDYVLLIESGIFYETYDEDATILNKLLNYKILSNNMNIRLGFPKKIIDKVLLVLESKHINYLILDKDNNIINRKKYKDNKYSNYVKNISNYTDANYRIEKICNKLKSKIEDANLEELLSKIEDLL